MRKDCAELVQKAGTTPGMPAMRRRTRYPFCCGTGFECDNREDFVCSEKI